MAAGSEIVADLMEEIGKMSPDVETSLMEAVGDVTVDLLSQNEGRFEGLRRRQTITIDSSKTQYKLNSDCNRVKSPCLRYNSSGEPAGRIDIVNEEEYYYRLENATQYPTNSFAKVERLEAGNDGPGYYLIFKDELTDVGTIQLFYYRYAKETDTDIIRNPEIVKTGVRSKRPQYWPATSREEMIIYFKMRSAFKENPQAKTTRDRVLLSARRRKHNLRMHRYGRGG